MVGLAHSSGKANAIHLRLRFGPRFALNQSRELPPAGTTSVPWGRMPRPPTINATASALNEATAIEQVIVFGLGLSSEL